MCPCTDGGIGDSGGSLHLHFELGPLADFRLLRLPFSRSLLPFRQAVSLTRAPFGMVVSLDGEVASGMIGADWSWHPDRLLDRLDAIPIDRDGLRRGWVRM